MALIKNSILNVAGILLPTIASIPALGFLARSLGTELFGIFTIAIAIVGYSSIFDVGLTRALVREVSIYRNNKNELNPIIATATIFVLVVSGLGCLLMVCTVPNIIHLLKISPEYISEAKGALLILSLSIPIFLLNQIWLAIPEGQEMFGSLNTQRVISSLLTALMPVVFVLYQKSLISAMYGLLCSRIIAAFICYLFNRTAINSAGLDFRYTALLRLIKFGGWITVSNIISPIMVYFDRFIVSNIMGANHVAFYTAPSEAISRLTMLPGALSRAVFPRLSNMQDKSEYNKNLNLAYKLMTFTMLPLVIIICSFAKEIMTLWMGDDYAGTPVLVLQILTVGFLFNSFAQIPFTSIQALGRSKITAAIHLIEVIPYLFFLYFCVLKFGVVGAAIAWSLRVITDCILLLFINRQLVNTINGDKSCEV